MAMIDFNEPQTAEPIASGTKHAVINPFAELRKLALAPAEIPVLIPFLTDEDDVLAFGYWRDVHPDRYVYTVGWLIGRIIDEAAKRRLARWDDFPRLDAESRKLRLDDILCWCKINRDTSRDQLPDDLGQSASASKPAIAGSP